MEPLDGNAIAGLLYEAFGAEMTTAVGVCARCHARGPAAELRVYLRGPGAVGRCRNCGAILIVITHIHGVACVDLEGFDSLEPAGGEAAATAGGRRGGESLGRASNPSAERDR